jgi:uncharacterized protein YbjT (DUF2867 family)
LNDPFRVLVAGGTGQVGSAVVRALLACADCKEIVAVVRKPGALDERVRQVVLDSAAATFEGDVAKLARSIEAPLYGVSCIGIGKGTASWSEEDMTKLEVGVVGAFARGCFAAGVERFALLSAAGSTPKSRIKYVRVMGQKEEAVKAVSFPQLAIFRPGIIAGNVNTPGYVSVLGRLIPGSYGTIDQDDIGRAFVAQLSNGAPGVMLLENSAMKKLARP